MADWGALAGAGAEGWVVKVEGGGCCPVLVVGAVAVIGAEDVGGVGVAPG